MKQPPGRRSGTDYDFYFGNLVRIDARNADGIIIKSWKFVFVFQMNEEDDSRNEN